MHVVVGLLPCMLLDDVACLHVERNMLVEASYLDIEDTDFVCVTERERVYVSICVLWRKGNVETVCV